MATPTYTVPIQEFYGEDAITLSSTAAGYINCRNGYRGVQLYCASQAKIQTNPRIHSVLFYGSVAATYTDYTSQALDSNDSTHVPLDGMIANDYLYIGCQDTFLGFYAQIDASNKNAVTATLDVEYYNGSAWTDVAGDADGTDSTGTQTGATLEQSGVYTFTAITDWAKTTVDGKSMYWLRFTPSTTLSATIDIERIISSSDNTAYGWLQAGEIQGFTFDTDQVGGLQYLSSAGTPSLYLSWIKYRG